MILKIPIVSILLYYLFFPQLYAQNQIIDSLEAALQVEQVDSLKVDLLNQLAEENYRIEPSKTIEYAKESFDLASSMGYEVGVGGALRMFGFYYESQGENDSALYFYSKALTVYESIGNAIGKANSYNDLGVLYYSHGDYVNALKYLTASKEANIKLNNSYGAARAQLNISHIFTDRGQLDSALYNLEQALEVFITLENEFAQAICLVNMGIVYKEQGKLDDAMRNFEKGMIVAEEMGNKYMKAKIFNNYGVVNEERADFARAIDNYQNSLRIYEELGSLEGQTEAFANIGVIHRQLGEVDKAIEYYHKAMAINLKLNAKFDEQLSYIDLASAYFDLSKFDSSLYYYRKAYFISDSLKTECNNLEPTSGIGMAFLAMNELDSAALYLNSGYVQSTKCEVPAVITNTCLHLYKLYNIQGNNAKALYYLNESFSLAQKHQYAEELKRASESLYKHYKDKGNYALALNYLEVFQTTNDSIFNASSTRKIATLTSRFEFEKEKQELENEIGYLSTEAKIQELELESKTYQIIGIAIVSLMIISFVFLLYSRRNYKLKASLADEKDRQQKLRFKAVIEAEENERKRIARELHDGLGQLLSTARLNVSVLEPDDGTSDQVNNSLKLIDDAVDEVRSISHNMMPNALISIGFEAAVREQVHLINGANQVKVHLNLPEKKIPMDESKAIGIYRIIQEIVNNALKYSNASNIWLNIDNVEGRLNVEIKDDGEGFEMSIVEKSTGIGWSNIISRAEILDGELLINSEIGGGSLVSLKMAV